MTTEAEATAEAPVTEAPVNETDTEREQILKALAEHDRAASGIPEPQSERSQPSEDLATEAPDQDQDAPEQAPAKAEGSKEPEAGKPSREQKEQDRYDRNWSKLQADKEALKREKEELEAFKKNAFREVREARHKAAHKPEDYEAAAEQFEDEGREDLAEQARKAAQDLRSEYEAEQAELARFKANQAWQANLKELADMQPELTEEGSPLNNAVKEVLESKPILQSYPDGIKDAVYAANLMIENQSLKSVQSERDELKAKVEELEKKLQPGGAPPSAPAPSSDFASMTSDQQRDYFRRKFQEADQAKAAIVN